MSWNSPSSKSEKFSFEKNAFADEAIALNELSDSILKTCSSKSIRIIECGFFFNFIYIK